MVRVRFAPSPTGPLHMGGVRTALYNYLFAKKHNGTFVLRIEDTDQARYVPGAEEYIQKSLEWCGITPDEGPHAGGEYGPYRQSERKEIYREYADMLVEKGYAYYAFDTSEELEEMRDRAKKSGFPNWQYNSITRERMKNTLTLPEEEVQRRLKNNDPYVIRIKLPRDEEVKFEDIVRGWVSVNTKNMDDKVLFKSDGMPTYHLANIVDDYRMKITHVIRGEEWLPSAPLHVLLYRYLGLEDAQPAFAHLPLLLKPDGNGKLSKRDGDRLGFPVFPLEWHSQEGDVFSGYKENGYFPQAFVNMLAFLGWNPGTEQEIFSLDELVEAFDLKKVNKAGARFDFDKTKWFNQQYLRKLNDTKLATEIGHSLREKGIDLSDEKQLALVPMLKERAVFISDMLRDAEQFLNTPEDYDEKSVEKRFKGDARDHLKDFKSVLQSAVANTPSDYDEIIKTFLTERNLGFGKIGPGLRLALTGTMAGPALPEIIYMIGVEAAVTRIDKFINKFTD
ncbi:MAG: glutamate--tRNA ligase [Cryomorphaceae bacterium]|nr:glutamate--tRNA ligase [Cryomorphaceae bacterium]